MGRLLLNKCTKDFKKENSSSHVYSWGNRMSPRKRTILYLNPEIVKEARDLGLHISMIANDSLKQAIEKMKKFPAKIPDRWKLKLDKEMETEWVCYYCGNLLGIGGRLEGAKLGKCPTCGAEQVGPGVTIITKDTKAFLRKLERRLKDEERLRSEPS